MSNFQFPGVEKIEQAQQEELLDGNDEWISP